MAFTVSFEELHPYPKSVWVEGQFLGTRQLKCAWSDRVQLLQELDYAGNVAWPYADGPSDALLFKVQTDSLGKQSGAVANTASYDWAVLTCWYRNQGPLLYGNKDLITEWIEGHYGGETVPWGNLRWTSGASTERLLPSEAPQFLVGSFTLAQSWHRVSAVEPWVYLRTRRVNPAPYACFALPYVFPAQTMLYMPPRIIRTATLWGLPAYDVTVRYAIHPSWADGGANVGWNMHWREATMRYEPLYIAGGSQYIQYPAWTV